VAEMAGALQLAIFVNLEIIRPQLADQIPGFFVVYEDVQHHQLSGHMDHRRGI